MEDRKSVDPRSGRREKLLSRPLAFGRPGASLPVMDVSTNGLAPEASLSSEGEEYEWHMISISTPTSISSAMVRLDPSQEISLISPNLVNRLGLRIYPLPPTATGPLGVVTLQSFVEIKVRTQKQGPDEACTLRIAIFEKDLEPASVIFGKRAIEKLRISGNYAQDDWATSYYTTQGRDVYPLRRNALEDASSLASSGCVFDSSASSSPTDISYSYGTPQGLIETEAINSGQEAMKRLVFQGLLCIVDRAIAAQNPSGLQGGGYRGICGEAISLIQ